MRPLRDNYFQRAELLKATGASRDAPVVGRKAISNFDDRSHDMNTTSTRALGRSPMSVPDNHFVNDAKLQPPRNAAG